MKKTIEFETTDALETWKASRYPFVYVLEVDGLYYNFGYETSKRLPRPKIHVTYLEFYE